MLMEQAAELNSEQQTLLETTRMSFRKILYDYILISDSNKGLEDDLLLLHFQIKAQELKWYIPTAHPQVSNQIIRELENICAIIKHLIKKKAVSNLTDYLKKPQPQYGIMGFIKGLDHKTITSFDLRSVSVVAATAGSYCECTTKAEYQAGGHRFCSNCNKQIL